MIARLTLLHALRLATIALLTLNSYALADPSKSVQSVEIQVAVTDRPLKLPDVPTGSRSLAGVLTSEELERLLKSIPDPATGFFRFPVVYTRSEREAKIQITQQIRYATEYREGNPPVPAKFTNSEVGAILEVTPTLRSGSAEIDLKIHLRISQLTGYQDLEGNKVEFPSVGLDKLIGPIPDEFPFDETVQPIIATREVTTSALLYDGSTVALGGGSMTVLITAKIVKDKATE